MKRSPLQSDPDKAQAFIARGRVSSAKSLARSQRARGGISPASDAQRVAVERIGFCLACGRRPSFGRWLTPGHLWPRDRGGCDHKDCTGPLCMTADGGGCHAEYDERGLDLLRLIVRHDRWDICRPLVQHALEHARPVELIEKLANDEVVWRSQLTGGAQ